MPYNFPGFTASHEFRESRPKSKFGFHGGQASGVAAAPSSAASSLGIPRAPSGVGSGAGDVMGGVFKWIGNGLIPSAEASPSKLLPQGGAAPDFPGDSDGSVADASEAASPLAKDSRRYLSRRVVGQGSAFDAGAPAVPVVPSNAGLAPDNPNSFDDRFGSWISTGGATPGHFACW